jgi:TPR repeat protein
MRISEGNGMRFLISSICVFSFLSCTFSIADEPSTSQEFLHSAARAMQSLSGLEAMADTGNCAAIQQLGKVYLSPFPLGEIRVRNNITSSFAKAADYFRLSVECGLDSTQVWNNSDLVISERDSDETVTEKVNWYKKAAKDGFPVAQRILAIHLGYGDESLKLLKKSAESGDDKALLLLANRYTLGLGVNPSSLTAKNYLDQVQISSLELIEAWHDLKRST